MFWGFLFVWFCLILFFLTSEFSLVLLKSLDSKYLKECAPLSEAQTRTEKESSTDEGSSIPANPSLDVQSVKAYDGLHETDLG